MKYEYITATGKITVKVDDEWSCVLLEIDRAEYNANQKETRRHVSLDAYNLDDALLPSGTDIESEFSDKDAVCCALSHLTERQQYLIRKTCLEGWKYTEIAALEAKDESAIRHSVERAKKKLKKYLR